MRHTLLLALCVISCYLANAQINCGSLSPKQEFFRLNKKNAVFQTEVSAKQAQVSDTGAVYTLPVVVHVITTGDAIGSPDNPKFSVINAMIANLNNHFRKKDADDGGVDMRIQFKLAVRSPTCGATQGLVRVDGSSIPNYVSGGITNIHTPGSADESLVKALSDWPNTDYVNIWIVNKINGSSTSPGGYTYFPEYNTAALDGLVLNASVVDGTNLTIVHEMGHFFSLYHPFNDDGNSTTCAANDDCSKQGDRVCDTEVELNVPCNTTTNSCNGNAPFAIADATKHYTVLNNYMGYTTCQHMFTQGQKTRARNALLSFRYGLITSKALTTPDSSSVVAACTPTAQYGLSPYYGVQQVDFNNLHVYSNSSQADGNIYVDRTCNQQTTVTQGKSYTLRIIGSYGNPHRMRAYIDYNNDGIFSSSEQLLSVSADTTTKTVKIPTTNVVTNVPLRMRIIADNPSATPTSCQLHGTANLGAGQMEDYAVIIKPAASARSNQNVVSEESLHVNVYPNPVSNLVNVVLYNKQPENISLHIIDAGGNIMQVKKVNCHAGENLVQLDVHALAAGVYYLNFNNQHTFKIVKQ